MRRVYLDHSATTPVHPEVAEALWPFFSCRFGNPSSYYSLGLDARKAVEQARDSVARFLCADPEEVVFTSGGTESNNLALVGAAFQSLPGKGRVITSQIEHAAVLEPAKSLEKLGFEVVLLPVDRLGRVALSDLENAVTPNTALVSIMMASNETGIIQDIPALAERCHRRGVLFHTDAVQAFGKMPVDVKALGADLLSVSGHKAYAPKGVGALYIRRGVNLDIPLKGGGQEAGVRPGTENVPGIVGLGKVSQILAAEMGRETQRLRALRSTLRGRILSEVEGALVNSDCDSCLCNMLSVCISGVKAVDMITALDRAGVYVSSGSACKTGSSQPSHVLLAMGLGQELAEGAIRISMGRDNTEEDVHYAADCIRDAVTRLRAASGSQG